LATFTARGMFNPTVFNSRIGAFKLNVKDLQQLTTWEFALLDCNTLDETTLTTLTAYSFALIFWQE
jgi:hypothetical protein